MHEVSEPSSRLLVPPVYLAVALLLMGFFHNVTPLARVIHEPYRYGGLVLIGMAIALIAWAALLFRRAGTDVRPFKPSTALVTDGPYSFTRNPMYLGMAGILLGAAVYLGSLMPFIVIPAFMAVITERFILGEEQKMERAFGSHYLAYKEKVRRWL